MLTLVLSAFPISYASQDLVTNGGFETGDFTGWTTTDSNVRISQFTEQAHSGRYSARIGALSTEGSLSRTVSIPAKSIAKFTAWYEVEQGSRLSILLKSGDGSVIQQWSFASTSPWKTVTYDLSVSCPILTCPAGKDVTIEFVGQANGDYWPYIDDISLTYTVVLYETSVVVTGFLNQLSTKLLVDGRQVGSLAGDVSCLVAVNCNWWWASTTLTFKIGETHTISVESYLYKDNGTRYYSASNWATVNSDSFVVFSYQPQYYLSVISPYGTTTGSGWYDTGSIAEFSVTSRQQETGLFGSLRGRALFQAWTGDSIANMATATVIMDGPKTVRAQWTTDDFQPHAMLVGIGAAIAVVITLAFLLIRAKERPPWTHRGSGPLAH